ncbi:uncharacterized protein LOC116247176 isoform X3 [Nymphaea colorata]|uniref:uncharacterized protein LOC116247176 isoform X3 n=1 Tax=Nymphaea colorata TaxID=210225 RepID=UPI00129EE7F8|nr:uncharacterized protein LOC116247176 isoform X3 [Nymphaea colorata]
MQKTLSRKLRMQYGKRRGTRRLEREKAHLMVLRSKLSWSQFPSLVAPPLRIYYLSLLLLPSRCLSVHPQAKDNRDGGRQYLQAEVDGGLGRDMLEFLVKEDVVAYRCMATKVTYIYPFTTAFGDSKGQHERLKKISDVLGWYAPDFETMNE